MIRGHQGTFGGAAPHAKQSRVARALRSPAQREGAVRHWRAPAGHTCGAMNASPCTGTPRRSCSSAATPAHPRQPQQLRHSPASCARGRACARRRDATLVVQASAAGAGLRKQLPIFPLSTVALPHAVQALQIFEPRYRVLFNTLLAGSPNIEEGLVQADSPFAGSRRFGMCFVDSQGNMASVGTTLEIRDYAYATDGRIYITNQGVERFRVVEVVKKAPVLICEVEVLPEDEDDSVEARELAAQVADLFRTTVRLHAKMARIRKLRAGARPEPGTAPSVDEDASEDEREPEELIDLRPCQLSYWLASVFLEAREAQQMILQANTTLERLEREKQIFEATLKYYRAATALEGVFGSSGDEPQPPPGGPD